MTTITTTGPHGLKAGDIIYVASTVHDTRWWALLWSWLLRRPPPMRTVVTAIRVIAVDSTWFAGDKG